MAHQDNSMAQIDQPPAATVTILPDRIRERRWTSNKRQRVTRDGRAAARRSAHRAPRARRPPSPTSPARSPTTRCSSEEGLALMEHNADTILEEIGIDFRDDPEALADLEGGRRRRQGRARAFRRAACAARWCRKRRRANSPSTRAIRRAAW